MCGTNERNSEDVNAHTGNDGHEVMVKCIGESDTALLYAVRIDFHREHIKLGDMVKYMEAVEILMLKDMMDRRRKHHE